MEEMLPIPRPSCLLHLPLGSCKSSFNLEKAVCNHGFFMMSPNKWIPSTKTLQRPLRLADSTSSVVVSISHPPYDATTLHVYVHGAQALSLPDQQTILEQVGRMLRITDKDEMALKEFHNLHPRAKHEGFGRIFRSPSLFEDAVKSMLLCYCTWGRTLKMTKSLCELQLKLVRNISKKRKRGDNEETITFIELSTLGNFPSSKELATLNETELNKHCNLGYRATHIIKFAQNIEGETLKLNKFEQQCDFLSCRQVYHKLNKIKGFGPFTIATILMCLGCYQKVPVDTETIRHLKEVHGRTGCNKKTISKDVEEIYREYAPFECIAYWFELLGYYEKRYGKLSELSESNYHLITGSINHLKEFGQESERKCEEVKASSMEVLERGKNQALHGTL